jgi:hypothetical protein
MMATTNHTSLCVVVQLLQPAAREVILHGLVNELSDASKLFDGLFVSGELAVTSSGGVLELLLPRHVSRADASRENKRRYVGIVAPEPYLKMGDMLELFLLRHSECKESIPSVRTLVGS